MPNPYIHGTSSQTLSLMESTDFQLMPVIAMLEDFKVAPRVGELTQGGFAVIGDGSNKDTMAGAPAFGRLRHPLYDLDKVIGDYAKNSGNISLHTCKENFKNILTHSHKKAFANLNLLMVYLVRLRQLGVKAADIAPLHEINSLKERLNATVQFYYFILCIQKYIFIDGAEIERFKKENTLNLYEVDKYIKDYLSFENFIEKIRKTGFSIEEVYNSPSSENINKLLEFVKFSKDYHFFTTDKYEPECKVDYDEIDASHLFINNSNNSLAHYFKEYYLAYRRVQEKREQPFTPFPDFEKFHGEVLPYIEAMKERIKLCNTLIDAEDKEFVQYNQSDELVTNPFPVIFVTEANTVEVFEEEYRSPVPLKLGKDISLVATDNKDNQKKIRDYLQKNNVGPVEVLLFDDLQTLRSNPNNCFDAFANDNLVTAFELAKKQNCVAQFSKLYRALSELNEKRYRFKSTNQEMYGKLSNLFVELQQNVLTSDKNKINFKGIQDALQRNKQKNYALYASHRGILGVIDTLLTIVASLVIFYPITYLIQKSSNCVHTFFETDTESKINKALDAADEITRHF